MCWEAPGKAVTKRLRHDIQQLILTTQLGGRNASSCLDVSFMLIRDANAAHLLHPTISHQGFLRQRGQRLPQPPYKSLGFTRQI